MNDEQIYFLGDIHGEWPTMLYMMRSQWKLRDCTVIQVGDFGAGFDQSRTLSEEFYGGMNAELRKRNIRLLVIRGNHDDPSHFQGQFCFSHLELLPDYTYRKIGRCDFLFVGGAVSVDRSGRIAEADRRKRKGKRDKPYWWPDEIFVLRPEDVRRCDVLVTHSAPTWVGPWEKTGIAEYCKEDEHLWFDCMAERGQLNELVRLVKPRKAFSGHFHDSYNTHHEGCTWSILGIMELKELRL